MGYDMYMTKIQQNIVVQNRKISIIKIHDEDYISLTDMVKSFGDDAMIYQWMRNRNTVEFIGVWEQLYNSEFKGIEFDTFKKQAGLNSFSLTPKKWIETTNAIGFVSKAGRYGGGTFAHKDIAFEFGTWLSPQFKLYLIKEFQRLKEEENLRLAQGWDIKRILAKINYKIHTDAVKAHLIPMNISKNRINMLYANEADILNVALFGKTAKEWRDKNQDKVGNIRDYADITQLVVLSNLEGINAELIRQEIPQSERLLQLNQIAIAQMQSLLGSNSIKKLRNKD
jgi:hypothetical protein